MGNRRNKEKYPGLCKHLNLKRRLHLIDYDYIDKLNEAEKEWLNKFTEEFVSGSFKNDGTDLHNTDELKKSCYSRVNSLNRDLYTLLSISNMLYYIEDLEHKGKL